MQRLPRAREAPPPSLSASTANVVHSSCSLNLSGCSDASGGPPNIHLLQKRKPDVKVCNLHHFVVNVCWEIEMYRHRFLRLNKCESNWSTRNRDEGKPKP
mmetsp:Transcript_46049/g.92395  ORF Transcript_46049/g.92395 Transcript_46049/m.92395 type:complete len:100 (-) Transcript_46049:268-567(-)